MMEGSDRRGDKQREETRQLIRDVEGQIDSQAQVSR